MAKSKANLADYAVMVEPLSDADGGGWLATVPALPGCMGDGDTPEAALADAEAAIVEAGGGKSAWPRRPRPRIARPMAATRAQLAAREIKVRRGARRRIAQRLCRGRAGRERGAGGVRVGMGMKLVH